MGASVQTIEVNFRQTGISSVIAGMNQVKAAAKATGTAAHGIADGSAIYGLAELSRGLGRVAQSGTASSMAMRELVGGFMRLGAGAGPIVGLIGVLGLLGGTVAEVFMHMREEITQTETRFNESLVNMAHAASVEQLAGPNSLQSRLFSGDALAGILNPKPDKTNGDIEALKQLGVTTSDINLAYLARTGGITGLKAEQSRRAALVHQALLATQSTSPMTEGARNALDASLKRSQDDEKKVSDLLGQMQSQYDKTSKATGAAVFQAVERMTNEIQNKHDKGAGFTESDNKFLEALQKGEMAEYYRKNVLAPLKALGVQAMSGGIGGAFGNAQIGGGNILDPFFGKGQADAMKGPQLGKIVKTVYDQLAEESMRQQESFGSRIATQISDTFGGAIATGMRSAFQAGNIGAGFMAFGKSVLAGLGSVFVEIGEHALMGLTFMKAISDAIIAWNPIVGAAAAVGLIALGSAMEAAASGASHSMAHYGGSSAVGAYAAGAAPGVADPRTIGTASGITAAPTIHNHFTVFGKDDPRAQREIAEMIARTARRGTTSG